MDLILVGGRGVSSLVRLLQIELELAYIASNEVTSPDKTSDLLFILVYIYLQAFIVRELLSNGPTNLSAASSLATGLLHGFGRPLRS